MQAERDHLVRFVFPKLREELLPHRIHFVDVDLRWGVTGDEDATEVCREVIGECRPRFLCILGGRYGWVPKNAEKSITADEIEFGVLNPPANDHGPVRAFFYFRKDEDTQVIPEADACAGGYREFATADEVKRHGLETAEAMARDRASKLAELKNAIVAAELPVFHYPARWDTAQKRLAGLETFGNQVHADLLQSLKDDPELCPCFIESDTASADEFQEEADQMEAFIEERTERYVVGSRQPLLDALEAFASADDTPNILVLTGEPGSGKSAILAKFVRDLAARHPSSIILPHFIGASTGSTDLRRTLSRLCHELALSAGNTEPLPLDIKEIITHFQNLLAEASRKQRVILVFDAINQFDATDGAHWMNWLPRELPPGGRIIASVIAPDEDEKEHQTLAILRNRPDARVENLKPLNESDTLAIIEGYLNRYSKRLSAEQIAALYEKPSSKLPLYVLTALEELRTLGTYEEITDRIRTLPGDARTLFGWILTERLANDPGFRDREGQPCGSSLVEEFAACLGVSRHGLSPAELTALLDPGDPLGNVAALLRLLRPYLMRRGELLDFYHGQFREAAWAAHLDTPEKQRVAHQSVATCLQAFADPHRDGQCRDATPHALSELPHHQTRAEAWPDLIATLENILFLEPKVTNGMAFDLVEDFTAAVDALPPEHVERQRLRLLKEALRRDIHFIARHAREYPQALFQCLWNSCWWYDCPAAAACYSRSEQLEPICSTESKVSQSIHLLLENWLETLTCTQPSRVWLRANRPPAIPLGGPLQAVIDGDSCVAFSNDGRLIAYGSGNTCRVSHPNTTGLVACLAPGPDRLRAIAFSPDSSRIAVAWCVSQCRETKAHWVLVMNIASSQVEVTLKGHSAQIHAMAFSPGGGEIATASEDKTFRVWSAHTGEQEFVHAENDEVNSITYSPDGKYLATGTWSGKVSLWDTKSHALIADFCPGEVDSLRETRLAFSPQSNLLAANLGFSAQVWAVPTGSNILGIETRWELTGIGFSHDGSRIAVAEMSKIKVFAVIDGSLLTVLRGHEGKIEDIVFDSRGHYLASVSKDNTVRLWNAQASGEAPILKGHTHAVTCAAVSADGRYAVSGSKDNTVRLWDAAIGAELLVFRGHEAQVNGVAISTSRRFVVSGSHDKTVRIWNAVTGGILRILLAHTGWVFCVAVSPDERLIASGGWDGVRIWDIESGDELALLDQCDSHIQGLAFSPDGRTLYAFEEKGWRVRLWNVASRECVQVQRANHAALSVLTKEAGWPLGWDHSDVRSETVIRSRLGENVENCVAWWPEEIDLFSTSFTWRCGHKREYEDPGEPCSRLRGTTWAAITRGVYQASSVEDIYMGGGFAERFFIVSIEGWTRPSDGACDDRETTSLRREELSTPPERRSVEKPSPPSAAGAISVLGLPHLVARLLTVGIALCPLFIDAAWGWKLAGGIVAAVEILSIIVQVVSKESRKNGSGFDS